MSVCVLFTWELVQRNVVAADLVDVRFVRVAAAVTQRIQMAREYRVPARLMERAVRAGSERQRSNHPRAKQHENPVEHRTVCHAAFTMRKKRPKHQHKVLRKCHP